MALGRPKHRKILKPSGATAQVVKTFIPRNSRLYRVAFDAYWRMRRKWNNLVNALRGA